jgi:hypothetical protein
MTERNPELEELRNAVLAQATTGDHSAKLLRLIDDYEVLLNEDKARESTLTFEHLREANVARCERVFHPLNDWSPTDWACCMAGEAGEACNQFKKLKLLEHKTPTPDIVGQRQMRIDKGVVEVADTVIYADLLAARMGRSLGEVVRFKFNKVSIEQQCLIRL